MATLVHATFRRVDVDVPFRAEIDASHSARTLDVVRKAGPLNREEVQMVLSAAASPVCYVAGPVDDVKNVRDLLASIGIADHDIRLESFRYPGSLADPPLPLTAWEWDQLYRSASGDDLPWYLAGIDSDLARAIDTYGSPAVRWTSAPVLGRRHSRSPSGSWTLLRSMDPLRRSTPPDNVMPLTASSSLLTTSLRVGSSVSAIASPGVTGHLDSTALSV